MSTSSMRPAYAGTEGPSMADSLPSANFGFEELRDRMAKFTTKFDDFIEKGIKGVLEERTQFRKNVVELKEDHRMKKKDIEILKLKTDSHEKATAKEAQEAEEMRNVIASLSSQRESRAEARDELAQTIAETQKLIDKHVEAQRQHAQYLNAQARFNMPELDFWQDYLCLRIEGAGMEDHLKFIYTHIDDRDWEREAWFELGMGKRDYEVLHCKPKLRSDAVEKVLDKLNESRDVGYFLKGMRELFVEVLK
ncbi:MAG: kinetochore-associated Ndc80 complex subunit spc25 [Trizodia sp. TS-e1964]|nr:MAG: kinetochore-associated Ndc80 complex subunit spc25 [Trizodia sp. TS-e1964]